MQIGQKRAFAEVQRLNGALTRAMCSSDKQERQLAPVLRDELDMARIILAFERGMAQLVQKGGSDRLSRVQMETLFDHIRNREGHTS